MAEAFEHYQLLENPDGTLVELGRGAMGITYKAFDTNLCCNVALKVINSSLVSDGIAAERFLREARGAAQLRHRNVASVFHLGKHGDVCYYAMELIDGETVDAMVKRDGPLPTLLALDIAQQVACALIAAEKKHLVHRDIKPSNLMLVRESDDEILVKVIDFGLVKSAVVQAASGALTATGFVGTPYFASPEQLNGQAEDVRSDIYSLGVTLWFMLTGRPPFMGTVASVIAQHLDRSPAFESLAVLPTDVVAVLRRMLQKDPHERMQSPSQLRVDLRACIDSLKSAPPPSVSLAGDGANFETVVLSGSNGLSSSPRTGGVIKGRYRLIEDLDPKNPGTTFHGEDTLLKKRVLLKILRGPAAVLAQIEEAVSLLQRAPHPCLMEVLAFEREATFSAAILEWLEGFPLIDLLRARRELTLREGLLLLGHLAGAVDRARELQIKIEMSARSVFVHFPDGTGDTATNVMLRCPLDEWPTFVVKVDPIGGWMEGGEPTPWGVQATIGTKRDADGDVAQLGALVYELLGGKAGQFTPLASLSEEGNAVLRRSLETFRAFATATEFYNALNATLGSEHGKRPPSQPAFKGSDSRRLVSMKDLPGRSKAESAAHNFRPPVVFASVIAIIVIFAGAALFYLNHSAPTANEPPLTTPATSPKAAVVRNIPIAPLQVGKPWVNSLGMRFVPLEEIHFAVCETRLRDFQAFVDATGYDAEGGMYSLAQDGFKQHGNSWKNPGFPQSPDHPIVGLSWDDAKQFCAWLTRKERNEGALSPVETYRLPTDFEWSQAAGLKDETGPTPEDRSEKIPEVYPWGSQYPPPPNAGNYAGAEARPGAPVKWAVIANYQDNFPRTAPVMSYPANAAGIFGLGGNVWEWCADLYNNTSKWRVLRGGSWATSRQEKMLSSYRRGYDPSFRHDDVGFRCVIATHNGGVQ